MKTFVVSVHFSAEGLEEASDTTEHLYPALDEHFPHWSMLLLPVGDEE